MPKEFIWGPVSGKTPCGARRLCHCHPSSSLLGIHFCKESV